MPRKNVAIVIDSTANLPAEMVDRYGIHVVPQIVNWDGKSLLDGIDITAEDFYQRLPQSKSSPTTSQPSAGEFHEHFQRVAEQADAIVGIFVSEKLSGTLSSARTAAEMMPEYPLEIVDSRSASMGLGLIALAAARAVEAGQDYRQVATVARDLVPRMRVMFVVDTLEYLHRGGRIGGAQRLIGSMLSIKPVLHLEDGRIEPLASVRTKRKAIQHMLDAMQAEMMGKTGLQAAVLHAVAPEEAGWLQRQLQERLGVTEVVLGELSPVIGTHVGPGTLGVACYGM